MKFSRRDWLRLASSLGAAQLLAPRSAFSHLQSQSVAAPQGTQPLFSEIPRSASGIDWLHENAMSPSRYLPEALGPGVAFLDFDNDGWMDIFLVNSGPSDFWTPPASKPVRNALYKNNRDGSFTDVTEKVGVSGAYFGMGVAVGDYDNDGWPDLFVTAYGKCILYKNNQNGTFTDVTEKAGLATPGWTTSAVWFDYDNDGKLDLFVCSFVDYSGVKKLECGSNQIGHNYYCVPRVFKPTASFLYHNNGDGTFTEVSKGTAIAKALGKGLGVVATDYDNDGLVDLFLANGHPDDMIDAYSMQVKYKEPLLLFHHGADGLLHDVSESAGLVFHKDFAARGLAIGDYDNDGALDVLIGVNGGAPVLLKNNAAKGNNWLGLKLEGVICNRDAIGARIVWKADGKTRQRLKNNGGSYLSSHDPREVLSIGGATQIDELEIHWPLPSKRVDKFTNLAPNRYLHIVEGKPPF